MYLCCWAATKKRHKKYCKSNKICEKGFLCKSDVFCDCPTCHQCPHCSSKSTCRGQTSHQFWKTWAALGASLSVLRILNEGYSLTFWTQPPLTWFPLSGCVHPLINSYLVEELYIFVLSVCAQKHFCLLGTSSLYNNK